MAPADRGEDRSVAGGKQPAIVRAMEGQARPRPGEWWYTVRCDRCSRNIHAYRDTSDGDHAARPEGPGELALTCGSCGHRASYPATKLRSQRIVQPGA
jgi:hypothetical protein